ncbi:hypothetical protein LTS18_010382, partial [Coniosporium uncinatum]
IDSGFVVAAIVPMIVVMITGENHLRTAWRVCLGLGVIPPLSLLYLRTKLDEPEAYKRGTMKHAKTPWWLVIKFYWSPLIIASLIWFIYDVSAYSFGLYLSSILTNLLGGEDASTSAPLWKSFGWNTLLTFFYMPGCILGSFLSDIPWLGPKRTITGALILQGVVGFIMAGCYGPLSKIQNVGGFVVMYGIFLALGEVGPGDHVGLYASKTSATAVRQVSNAVNLQHLLTRRSSGQYYGIAAAWGKVGAFVGTQVFPIIQDNAPNAIRAGQDPFFAGSALAIFSGVVAWFCLPDITQETIEEEDLRFREYLAKNRYDVSKMGLQRSERTETFE